MSKGIAQSQDRGFAPPALGIAALVVIVAVITLITSGEKNATAVTRLVDTIYYGLGATIALTLLVIAVSGAMIRHQSADPGRQSYALAMVLAALGTEASLLAGVGLNAISSRTGDLFYQQAHFSIFYVGFGFVLYAMLLVAAQARAEDTLLALNEVWRWVRAVAWSCFAAAVVVSGWFLLHAGTTAVSAGGMRHVPQQVVFFLPVFLVLALGATGLLTLAIRSYADRWERRLIAWFSVFCWLALLGFLREATVIPSSGSPLIDILVAFGPFAIGAVALYASERSLYSLPTGALGK